MKMRLIPLLAFPLVLAGCYSQLNVVSHAFKKNINHARGKCVKEGALKVGNPYKIMGKTYYPINNSYGYDKKGIASWYGSDFHGKATANGECYDMYAMTAAHKTLPLPTTVRVTNLENGRSVVLKVNDRGPYVKKREIDLSYAAAKRLGLAKSGTGKVRVQAIGGPHHSKNGKVIKNRVAVTQPTKNLPPPTQNTPKNSTAYRLTDRVLSGVTARVSGGKSVNVGGVNIGTDIFQDVSLKDVKDVVTEKRIAPENTPVATRSNVLKIQYGTFNEHKSAQSTWQNISTELPQVTLETVNINGSIMHRVRSGPYVSREEAHTALAKAHKAGFNDAIIVLDN